MSAKEANKNSSIKEIKELGFEKSKIEDTEWGKMTPSEKSAYAKKRRMAFPDKYAKPTRKRDKRKAFTKEKINHAQFCGRQHFYASEKCFSECVIQNKPQDEIKDALDKMKDNLGMCEVLWGYGHSTPGFFVDRVGMLTDEPLENLSKDNSAFQKWRFWSMSDELTDIMRAFIHQNDIEFYKANPTRALAQLIEFQNTRQDTLGDKNGDAVIAYFNTYVSHLITTLQNGEPGDDGKSFEDWFERHRKAIKWEKPKDEDEQIVRDMHTKYKDIKANLKSLRPKKPVQAKGKEAASDGGATESPKPPRDRGKIPAGTSPPTEEGVNATDEPLTRAKYKQSSASKKADHEVTSLIAQIRAELGGGGGGIAAGK